MVASWSLERLAADCLFRVPEVFRPLDRLIHDAFGAVSAAPRRFARPPWPSGVDGFVAELRDGYDTQVGERGLTLSCGQWQRVAIARALLKNASILVLDEETSSVDAASEAAIQSTLDTLAVGRTTLVIAHRPYTIRGADRIVVLDRRRVAEAGIHDSHQTGVGVYATLTAAQHVMTE